MNVDPTELQAAVRALREGDVVILPTETVYGLAADATNEAAGRRIFELKGRPADNPLIVHVADPEQLAQVGQAPVPEVAQRILATFAPGPVAVVVPHRGNLAPVVTAGLASVAVRIPDHPVALQVLRALGAPVAAPSANRSGRPSPTTLAMAKADMPGVRVALEGGPCRVGLESTVVDCTTTPVRILRPGAITERMLEDAGIPVGSGHATYRAPGTHHPHYRPAAKVYWIDSTEYTMLTELLATRDPGSVGLIGLGEHLAPIGQHSALAVRRSAADLASYGRDLYQAFVAMDAAGCREIVAVLPPSEGLGVALRDRLQRAGRPLREVMAAG